MCGISGFIDFRRRSSADELRTVAACMTRRLHHRGPDDAGSWVDAEAGLVLAHTRLAIVDLSPAGAQPMQSSCGRFVLSYNGEIYNAQELRSELEAAGREFRGHSDTEVLAEGCAVWGVERTVRRLIGMFAFAAWDRRERTLFLVRDRLGIKPVYWGRCDGRLVFGSELKVLQCIPGWRGELDIESLAAYLRFSYVPAPHSIFRNINKLKPGTILEVLPDGALRQKAYWSLAEIAARGEGESRRLNDDEAIEALDSILGDAVARRLVADVPLGAFLSGGVDSSAVVALMQKASDRPVKTFSIGFREAEHDESAYAAAVARRLGTEHTEFVVTPEDARGVIERLPRIFDEPFADSSQIPTYLVSELTRRHVTVALSGDGGDELFGGYNRYGTGYRVFSALHHLPRSLRGSLGRAMSAISPAQWDGALSWMPASLRPRHAGEKLHKLAAVLPEDTQGYYERLASPGGDFWRALPGAVEPTLGALALESRQAIPDARAWMQFMDAATYLPDDILTKVDRTSMAVALEARVPILDHRVVEFAWSLPSRFKFRNGQTKWLLRQVLNRYVPQSLFDRPKTGFGVPIGAWLRGPLRGWAEDLLDSSAGKGGLFDPAPIKKAWAEHQSGTRDWQHALWNVLMFEAWRREYSEPCLKQTLTVSTP
jgi:asparagine synthase (glutamine-hydrolysing)